MDGNPDDPIEVGSRTMINVEAVELALPDLIRMAIHDNVDKILDKVDPVNLDIFRIHVEKLDGYNDFDIDHNLEREIPPRYRVEARGMTKLKHLKEKADE